MAQLRIERVLALPAPEELIASTMYIVKGAGVTEAELYFTGIEPTDIRHLPTNAEIEQKIDNAVGSFSNIKVVQTIADRDALEPDRTVLVMVLDATGDPSVKSGSALYIYNPFDTTWYKVAEYESLDLDLTWDAIQGRPDSTPAEIDAAVAATHTHENMRVLDLLGEENGQLTYDGKVVGNFVSVAEW